MNSSIPPSFRRREPIVLRPMLVLAVILCALILWAVSMALLITEARGTTLARDAACSAIH